MVRLSEFARNRTIFITGLILLCIPLLLTACKILPVYDSWNSDTAARTIGQYEKSDVTGGDFIASKNVPWDVNVECRQNLPENQTLKYCADKPKDKNFVGLALSGGGSRAAVFSAAVLFELKRYGILKQVDVISSVSGGSVTAALYSLSCDKNDESCPGTVEGPGRMRWEREEVFDRLQINFINRCMAKQFLPQNACLNWFSYYSRSDMMAEVLDSNLYDESFLGYEGFRFHDLNPRRPNLLINSTEYTSNKKSANVLETFTFTNEDFQRIGSKISQFPISQAVMASAAFPAVFNYVSLENFHVDEGDKYIHLIDAAGLDNLGLIPLEQILERFTDPNKIIKRLKEKGAELEKLKKDIETTKKEIADFAGDDAAKKAELENHLNDLSREYADLLKETGGPEEIPKKIARLDQSRPEARYVIIVDAYRGLSGPHAENPDPRSTIDYFVDLNFVDVMDTLLARNRKLSLENLAEMLDQDFKAGRKPILHLSLGRDVYKDKKGSRKVYLNEELYKQNRKLYDYVTSIATTLSISDNETRCLQEAARIIVRSKIRQLTPEDRKRLSISMPTFGSDPLAGKCELD